MSNEMYNPFNWDLNNNGLDELSVDTSGGAGGPNHSIDSGQQYLTPQITLQQDGLVYTLLVNGDSVGTINIPEDQFMQQADYDAETKTLVFTMKTDEGEQDINVPIGDLVSSIEEDISDIELQLANFETKENVNAIAERVSIIENGVSSYATKSWVEQQGYLTEHQVIPPTNRAFKEEWETGVSVSRFCQDVLADETVKVGDSYLGELMCSGLPTGMINGEVKVEILGDDEHKILLLTVTSTNLAPYHWELTYLNGREYGWRAWMENVELSEVATSGDYADLSNTPSLDAYALKSELPEISESWKVNNATIGLTSTQEVSESFDYIYDESSWNDSFANGALKKYYAKYPDEDRYNTQAHRWAYASDKVNGEWPDYCVQCWEGAISADGAKFPWICPNFDVDVNAKIVFKYDGMNDAKPWGDNLFGIGRKADGGDRLWGIASVAEEFENNSFLIPQQKNGSEVYNGNANWSGVEGDKNFDITKFHMVLERQPLSGIATEQYADGKYQPKGEYLTEHQSLEGLATEEYVSENYQAKGEYLTEHQSLTDYATKSFVTEKLAELVDEAPETLNTLKELADAVEGNATLTELNVVKTKYNALLNLLNLTEAKVNNVIINEALEESNNVTFTDGAVDDIVIPETAKTTTVTAELEPESELTLTSPKGVTINNTSDEPTNLTVNAPADGSTPTVTLKDGEFDTVTLQDASLTVSNDAIVQNVVITEETTKTLTVSAIFAEGATVTSNSSAPVTVTNKNAEGEEVSIVLDAPNSTVTLSGGKWEAVDATVSQNTLIIKKAAKIQDLNVKRGNVIVEVAREEDIKNVISGDITLGEDCDTWLIVSHENFAEARHNQLEDYYNNFPTEAAQDGETWPPFTASKFPWLVVNHNFDGNTKLEVYYQGELKVEWTPSAKVTREDGTQVDRTYGILSVPEEFNLPQFAETNEGSAVSVNPEDFTVKLVSSTVSHKVIDLNSSSINNVFKSNILNDGEYSFSSDASLSKTLTTGVISNADVVWNLNAHTYTVNSSSAMFLMRGSAKLEVTGDGTMTNSSGYGVWISGGNGVVNSGRIEAVTHALYCEKGLIEVNGGTFIMANSDADKDENGNYRFLLNCLDKNYQAGTANIVVRGGKFYDFDPGNCAAEGPGTSFLAEGYESVLSTESINGVEHRVYTVREMQ